MPRANSRVFFTEAGAKLRSQVVKIAYSELRAILRLLFHRVEGEKSSIPSIFSLFFFKVWKRWEKIRFALQSRDFRIPSWGRFWGFFYRADSFSLIFQFRKRLVRFDLQSIFRMRIPSRGWFWGSFLKISWKWKLVDSLDFAKDEKELVDSFRPPVKGLSK